MLTDRYADRPEVCLLSGAAGLTSVSPQDDLFSVSAAGLFQLLFTISKTLIFAIAFEKH